MTSVLEPSPSRTERGAQSADARRYRSLSGSREVAAWMLTIAAVCAIGFVTLGLAVKHGTSPAGVDLSVDGAVRRVTERPALYFLFRHRARHTIDTVLSFAGFGWPILLAFDLGRRFWHRRDWRAAAMVVLLTLALPALVELVFKPLFGRRLNGDFAYPSGAACVFWGSAALGACGYGRLRDQRGAVRAGLAGVLVAATLTALLLQARWHYPTDLVGGALLGVGLVVGVWTCTGPRPTRRSRPT